jgi:hypothetical protein
MANKEYKKFVVGETLRDIIQELESDQKLRFYEAIMDYGIDKKKPNFTGMEKALWVSIRDVIDNTRPKRGGQQRNKNASKETDDKEEKTNENESEQKETNKTNEDESPNVNGNDNVNDNVNDNTDFSFPENPELEKLKFACQQDVSVRLEKLKLVWNNLDIGPPFPKILVNLTSSESSDFLMSISVWDDDMAIGAMRNYKRVKTEPDYDPGSCVYRSFIGFMSKGVEKYRDEAKPFDFFRKGGAGPPEESWKNFGVEE